MSLAYVEQFKPYRHIDRGEQRSETRLRASFIYLSRLFSRSEARPGRIVALLRNAVSMYQVNVIIGTAVKWHNDSVEQIIN